MITEEFYINLKKIAEQTPWNSLFYSEYEDVKNAECLVEQEDLIVLLNNEGVEPVIEFVSLEMEPLVTFLKKNQVKGALHFIPEEAIPVFEEIGFSILAMFTDYFCEPLTQSECSAVEIPCFANKADSYKLEMLSKSVNGTSRGFFGETKEWFVEWMQENHILVERNDTEIIGFCCVSIYNEGTTLWLRELCVHPKYQGFGIGSKLVRQALQYGLTNAAVKGFLAVDVENTSAIHIYEKYGFKRKAEEVEVQLVR